MQFVIMSPGASLLQFEITGHSVGGDCPHDEGNCSMGLVSGAGLSYLSFSSWVEKIKIHCRLQDCRSLLASPSHISVDSI